VVQDRVKKNTVRIDASDGMVAPSFAAGILFVAWALRLRLTLVTLILVACADSAAERRRLTPLLVANSVVGFVYMWREASRLVEEPQWVGVLQRDVRLGRMSSFSTRSPTPFARWAFASRGRLSCR
jgi:hypothetical protein